MITKSTVPLTNTERLAEWIMKRNEPLYFKAFKKVERQKDNVIELRRRPVAGGLVKDTLTGEVHEPLLGNPDDLRRR